MQKIKEYLLITIGVALTAIALEYFFFPCDIAAGGVSGIGLVINKVFGLDTSIRISFCCIRKRLWCKKYLCNNNVICIYVDN